MIARRRWTSVILLALFLVAVPGITLFTHTCRMMRVTKVSLHQHACGAEAATPSDEIAFRQACCSQGKIQLDLPDYQGGRQVQLPVIADAFVAAPALFPAVLTHGTGAALQPTARGPDLPAGRAQLVRLQVFRI